MEPVLGNVTEREHVGMRLFAARTGAKDVVSIEGSVHGGHYLLPRGKRMAYPLLAGILDAGTKKHGKEALRNDLAARGITLSFWSEANRTYFAATCLPEDISFTLKIIAECLSMPLLEKKELESERLRTLATLAEARTDTREQAGRAFARLVFDPAHINYSDAIEHDVKETKDIAASDVRKAQSQLGRGGLVLAIAGDITPEKVLRDAERVMSTLPEGVATLPEVPRNQAKPLAGELLVSVPDKTNIDAFFGMPLPITYHDARFVPLSVLSSMLAGGGIFSSHLAQTIRERDGLTYAIFGAPYGFAEGGEGALRIWANFAPGVFDQGVAATRKEIRTFLKEGITEDRLLGMQDRMCGLYAIGLSTSRGIAGQLHKIGREGKPLSYIDEYPSLIRAVSLQDLHMAAELMPADKFALAAAGTFTKK